MEHLSLKEVTGMISIGRDSIVFPCPGDSESLLKIYDNLSPREIEEYNKIHGKYGAKGEALISPDERYLEYARSKGWNITFLEKEVKGVVVRVLDLTSSEVLENPEGYTLAKVPLVKGVNLANHFKHTKDEEGEYMLSMIERMTQKGLECLGVPIEKRAKGGKILKKGHNIGRDNLMISGINPDGIIDITVTDIGFEIPDSLKLERELNGQSI